MQKPPAVFEHLGPHAQPAGVAACCRMTERLWLKYLELAGGYYHQDAKSREFLVVRMLYIAEITSSAIRLTASWGLTPAAMSLLRDRYEQTVRFSWLVRNPDPLAFDKFERTMFSKMGDLARSAGLETHEHFRKIYGALPAWATEPLTKEQRAFFQEWSNLDLRSMAQKRDAFAPLSELPVAHEKLATSYDAVYAQFSSVSHYDRFSLEFMKINKLADGRTYLGAQPYWPRMLISKNALFDIIQCYEATHVCHQREAALVFNSFLAEWLAIAKQINPSDAELSGGD